MTGLTTALLHADREAGIEHYAVHKPLHTSTTYGYADTRDLIDVFQGKPGYTYARQGNPTTAALEAKITMMEDGLATACFATGMAAIAAVFSTLLRAGTTWSPAPSCSATPTACSRRCATWAWR